MKLAKSNLFYHIKDISDPRKNINIKDRLIDIIFISICAVLCGCEYWEEIESFGKSKLEWFKKYLKLENGIPSPESVEQLQKMINCDTSCVAIYLLLLCNRFVDNQVSFFFIKIVVEP